MSRIVVHFTDASLFGGAEQMILNLLGALDRTRWTAMLAHHGDPGLEELIERARQLDIQTIKIARGGGIQSIDRFLRQTRPAIFHAHLNWPLACSRAVVAARLARIPGVVATQHLFVPVRSPRQIIRHKLISTAIDRYIAVSRHVAEMLRKVCVSGEKKVRVVHNGVPLAPFERAQSDWKQRLTGLNGRPLVLTVARLVGQKGIGYLIEAASQLPEAFFAVAGDGPDRPALEAKAESCGVKERFLFLGHRRDVPELLASCDLFVLPSLYEGLPVTVLEAMASAKPVLATKIGGTDEAIQDGLTGLLVPPADPTALAEQIRRLLADSDLARRLATQALEWVRREFSSAVVASRTMDLYEELVTEKQRRRLTSSAAGDRTGVSPGPTNGFPRDVEAMDTAANQGAVAGGFPAERGYPARIGARTVVHFTDTTGFGGAEQMLLTILAGSDRRRWEPVLIHHGEPGAMQLDEQARQLGIRTRIVPRLQGRRAVARLPHFVRALCQERASVFHAHLTWPLACTSGLIGADLAGIPAIIATQHCFVPIRSPRSVLIQKLVSALVDRYIAVSEEMARGMRPVCLFPRRKIQVIHNGVRLAPFARLGERSLRASLPRVSDRPIVLSLSRLDRPKGLSDLLSAAQLVPEACFVLAGEGRERTALEARARALGVADRILFLGQRNDIPDLLASCDVFVLPSLYEGLPVSVLEAMAAGKPVVATAVGGTREVVLHGETGLLVPPNDPAALAQAIQTILADPALARRMTEAGDVRLRQRFRAETMVDRIDDLYEEVLSSHRKETGRQSARERRHNRGFPDILVERRPKGADLPRQ